MDMQATENATAPRVNGAWVASAQNTVTDDFLVQLRRCPVEFGKLLRAERNRQKLLPAEMVEKMNAANTSFNFGRNGTAKFSSQILSKLEVGALGDSSDAYLAGTAGAVFQFFGWSYTELTETLRLIELPVPYAPTFQRKSGKTRSELSAVTPPVESMPTALQTPEQTMLDLVLRGLGDSTQPRNGLEDQLMTLAEAELDLATILQGGLMKMPPERRILKLSQMLQLVYGGN